MPSIIWKVASVTLFVQLFSWAFAPFYKIWYIYCQIVFIFFLAIKLFSFMKNFLPSLFYYVHAVILILTGCWRNQRIWNWQIDTSSCISAKWPAPGVSGGCSNPSCGAANCIREIRWPLNNNIWASRDELLGELLSVKTLSFKCTSSASCHKHCSGRSHYWFLTVSFYRSYMSL